MRGKGELENGREKVRMGKIGENGRMEEWKNVKMGEMPGPDR